MSIHDTLSKIQTKAQENQIPQKAMRVLSSTQGALEGGKDLRSLYTDDRSGRFGGGTLVETAARSAMTAEPVKKGIDKILDSQYGAFVPLVGEMPALRLKLMNKSPVLKIGLDSVLDRLDERKFEGAKATAVGQASSLVEGIAKKHKDFQNRVSAADVAKGVLGRQATFGRKEDFSVNQFVRDAVKYKKYQSGEAITPEERKELIRLGETVKREALDTKGLHTVYARKKGGLAGQRLKAAMAETHQRGAQSEGQLRLADQALSAAQEKLNRIVSAEGPDTRVKGPRIDVEKFKEAYKEFDMGKPPKKKKTKKASVTALEYIGQILQRDKLARQSLDNILEDLSSRDYRSKRAGEIKVITRRKYDPTFTVPEKIKSVQYRSEKSSTQRPKSLEIILGKLKKELYFTDDVVYTMEE